MVNYAKSDFIIKPTDKETSNITYDMIPKISEIFNPDL